MNAFKAQHSFSDESVELSTYTKDFYMENIFPHHRITIHYLLYDRVDYAVEMKAYDDIPH